MIAMKRLRFAGSDLNERFFYEVLVGSKILYKHWIDINGVGAIGCDRLRSKSVRSVVVVMILKSK